eukprot:TRINITY_DN2375_c0_g1_i5.p1 TRINITY_DN2375_c0_g1~~TRINITY_DN2375_c0_g1_i5.p1  ORF type:complete len:457 (-),score=139.48 TRINITY_DN2375_c0_g1_i5:328-1698(-)
MHSTDVAKLLVEMGQTKTADIDVNDRSDHNRSTALSRAAHRGDRGEVERLLRAGADKSIASKSGWLPYHNAIMQLVHMRQKLRGADTHDSGGGASGAVLPGFEGTSALRAKIESYEAIILLLAPDDPDALGPPTKPGRHFDPDCRAELDRIRAARVLSREAAAAAAAAGGDMPPVAGATTAAAAAAPPVASTATAAAAAASALPAAAAEAAQSAVAGTDTTAALKGGAAAAADEADAAAAGAGTSAAAAAAAAAATAVAGVSGVGDTTSGSAQSMLRADATPHEHEWTINAPAGAAMAGDFGDTGEMHSLFEGGLDEILEGEAGGMKGFFNDEDMPKPASPPPSPPPAAVHTHGCCGHVMLCSNVQEMTPGTVQALCRVAAAHTQETGLGSRAPRAEQRVRATAARLPQCSPSTSGNCYHWMRHRVRCLAAVHRRHGAGALDPASHAHCLRSQQPM